MSEDRPTIVVEVRGPQQSGVTTLAELISRHLSDGYVDVRYEDSWSARDREDLRRDLVSTGAVVKVREAEPDTRDVELMGLKLQVPRLQQEVERLKRRQVPESWSSPDGTEWSGISGDGVLDVRGSRADVDVVVSWRQAKDRLAWFEEHYRKMQARVAELERADEAARREVDVTLNHRPSRLPEGPVPSWDVLLDEVGAARLRFERLLVAFHDATRRHLGVTPDSGDEFYDHRMADEAEARRVRYGRGR